MAKDKSVRELFKIIRRLKRGVAVPVVNQEEDSEAEDDESNEVEDEEDEEEDEEQQGQEEDDKKKDYREKNKKKDVEEPEADEEGHENGEEEQEGFMNDHEVEPDPPQSFKRPAAAKAVPAERKPLIPLPPPPKTLKKKRKEKESKPEFEFPEIKPNPLAAGSGRSEVRKELDTASEEIAKLEKALGLLPGSIPRLYVSLSWFVAAFRPFVHPLLRL